MNKRKTEDITKVKGYRLLTEAEWEYAARGGKKSMGYNYAGSDNLDSVAWYDSNSGSKTHEVGQLKCNELGMYDISGNVEEWCSDFCDEEFHGESPTINLYNGSNGSRRLRRGDSWSHSAAGLFVSGRNCSIPTCKCNRLGFRIALYLSKVFSGEILHLKKRRCGDVF